LLLYQNFEKIIEKFKMEILYCSLCLTMNNTDKGLNTISQIFYISGLIFVRDACGGDDLNAVFSTDLTSKIEFLYHGLTPPSGTPLRPLRLPLGPADVNSLIAAQF
jgi:hypothetical protein